MAYLLGFLYLAAYIVIYVSLVLLPYYVAYSIIEPHSFFGVVGVFILGSVIVPLTLWIAVLVFGSFFVAFEKFKEKISQKSQVNHSLYSNESSPLDVTPKSEKKSSKETIFFTILGLSAIAIILFLALNGVKKIKEASYNYETAAYEESADDISLSYPDSGLAENIIQDNYGYMNYAVDEFLKTMSESGISGVAKTVRDCYVNADIDNLYCVYLDNTARLMDSSISEQMGFSRNDYLNDERVWGRNYKYYYVPTNTIHLAADHQKTIETHLIALLNEKVQETSYTSESISSVSTEDSAPYSSGNSYSFPLDVEMSQNFNVNTDDLPEELNPELVENGGETETEENSELEVGYE